MFIILLAIAGLIVLTRNTINGIRNGINNNTNTMSSMVLYIVESFMVCSYSISGGGYGIPYAR